MESTSSMNIRQYLCNVYPLAVSDISAASDKDIDAFFNNLCFYYKLNPQSEAVTPVGNYVAMNIKEMPDVGNLYSPSIINPDGFVCRNAYPPDDPLNNNVVKGFASNSDVEICHSNVYNGQLGVYYYLTPGSGVYVNLGNTLVANNKLDALRKLGFSNAQIANSLNTPGTAYWPAYYGGDLPPGYEKKYFIDLVRQYMAQYSCRQEYAENALINAAIDETDYLYGRVNDTGWQVDVDNFNLGRAQGYDTIQLTSQANMNNGWAFEIIDLRIVEGASLDVTMSTLSKYYSIRNPFNLALSQGMKNQWPYYNLYSEGTMSAIAKFYPSYQGRFPFAGPGYLTPSAIPGYPDS